MAEFAEAELSGESLSPEELEKIFSFADIPAKRWRFPGAIVRRTYRPGDLIVREGEHGTTAFYLLNGRVQVSIDSPISAVRSQKRGRQGFLRSITKLTQFVTGGPEKSDDDEPRRKRTHVPIDASIDLPMGDPVAELVAGDMFGEQAALAALKQDRIRRAKFYPRSASVRAITEVTALEMLPHILNNILYKAPAFTDKLNEAYKSRALDTHLRSVPVFQNVSQDFLDDLRARVDFANFEPGQAICRQGDLADCFYLIRLGLVKVSREFAGGEMVLTYLSRGDYFGEMGLLPPAVRVRAVGPQPGQRAEVYLARMPVVCGRQPDGEHTLAAPWDEFISREHFDIWMDGAGVRVKKRPQARNPIAFQFGPADESTLQPGEVFSIGETKFEIVVNHEESGHRTATCSAMDFVQLVRIEAEKFRELITRFPDVGEAIEEEARARRQMDAQILNSIENLSLEQFLTQDLVQGQNLLLFDLEKCTRCDECVKACIATHEDGVTRLIREGLRFEKYLVPTSCRACTDPVCMTRCPVGSIRRKGSLDIVIENWCIGCTNCATDCPFGNINMVPISGLVQIAGSGAKQRQKAETQGGLKAATCDLCVDYKEPNCVRACPHDAAFRVDAREFFSELRAKSSPTQSAVAEAARVPSRKPPANETIVMTRFQDFSAMLPKLRVLKGEKSGGTLSLQHPVTKFGRAPGNDHQFASDAQVSREHCRIRVEVGKFVIEDLGSNNGTFVNGNRVTEAQLREGDIIRIGESEMEFTGRVVQ